MYIRVISELKRWVRVLGKETKLPSDCFFDIKTQKNTLSLWKIDSQEDLDSLNKYIVIPTLGNSIAYLAMGTVLSELLLTSFIFFLGMNKAERLFFTSKLNQYVFKHRQSL